MGTDWGQKRYCDSSRRGEWHHFATRKQSLIVFFVFASLSPALAETAVNIGYSCRLLDPDTRLLEWQELRLAMIKIHKYTHVHTLTPSH